MGKCARSILIVEDDMVLSMVESRMVERLGYRVSGRVKSGEEAVRAVRSERPDAILMDIKLKGDMDGFDAMRKIRQIEYIPVIYVSGHSTERSHEKADQLGYSGYLIKPVRSEDLEEVLTNLFASSAATRAVGS